MEDITLKIFIGIVIAVVSSIVSAVITFHLSLKKFRTEKWWELKVEAYQRIIEALHNSKQFSSHHLEVEMGERKITEEKDKALRQKAGEANEEILKAIDIGGFLISDEAIERLKKYQNEADEASRSPSWFEYLDSDWAATDSCLKELIVIAKKDLRRERV